MYALLLELTTLLCFWLCLGAWQEEGAASGRRAFVCLALAVFTWSVGKLALLEGVATLELAQRVVGLGVILVPGLWLSLGLLAADHPLARHRSWLPAAIIAPQALLYSTLYGDFAPGFFYDSADGRTLLGPGGWLNAVYSWLLSALGTWLFLIGAGRLRAERVRRVVVCVASVAPLACNMAFTLGLFEVDPTPILLGVALLPLRAALFSGGWLHVLAVPEHAIVNHIPQPLVFTDRDGVVAGLNPAAQALLRISVDDALGRSLDAVLAELAPRCGFTRWPIEIGDALAGHAVLLASTAAARSPA